MEKVSLQEKINELESKIAFQELAIEELNQSLIEQQFIIDKLNIQLRHLAQKMQNIAPSNIASMSEETPPPHY